jgi:hypothetical protein
MAASRRSALAVTIDTHAQRLPKLARATERPEYRRSLTRRGLKALSVAF